MLILNPLTLYELQINNSDTVILDLKALIALPLRIVLYDRQYFLALRSFWLASKNRLQKSQNAFTKKF